MSCENHIVHEGKHNFIGDLFFSKRTETILIVLEFLNLSESFKNDRKLKVFLVFENSVRCILIFASELYKNWNFICRGDMSMF